MSIEKVLDAPIVVNFAGSHQENSLLIDQLSEPLVGKWNVLVSQTNWEKGALILRWRNELMTTGSPNTVYSDEAWAKRVGNVTAQHVGRLRRVAERFGCKNQNFTGLYWSHFYTALEWDDAELWLEGAVQNGWSVTQMRVLRWETFGASDEHKPREEDILVSEIDDDIYSQQSALGHLSPNRIEGRNVEIGAVDTIEGFDVSIGMIPESVTESPKKKELPKKDKAKRLESDGNVPREGELLMSLKGISQFPADLAEALEFLKVAILNHKLAGWKTVSPEQVCQSLDTLKMLTTAKN